MVKLSAISFVLYMTVTNYTVFAFCFKKHLDSLMLKIYYWSKPFYGPVCIFYYATHGALHNNIGGLLFDTLIWIILMNDKDDTWKRLRAKLYESIRVNAGKLTVVPNHA